MPTAQFVTQKGAADAVASFTFCFFSYFSEHAPEPEVRAPTEKLMKKRNQSLRDALQWAQGKIGGNDGSL